MLVTLPKRDKNCFSEYSRHYLSILYSYHIFNASIAYDPFNIGTWQMLFDIIIYGIGRLLSTTKLVA